MKDANNMEMETLLTERQLAEYLGAKPDTIRYWRLMGTGPAFLKLGAKQVRYSIKDVNEWLDRNRFQSTAELGSK